LLKLRTASDKVILLEHLENETVLKYCLLYYEKARLESVYASKIKEIQKIDHSKDYLTFFLLDFFSLRKFLFFVYIFCNNF
jgi:hypothetical protein